MKEKNIEYYFDSNIYNEYEVIEKMRKEQKSYPKQESNLDIYLNEFGTYVARLIFVSSNIKVQKRRNIHSKKKYGQYRKTEIYTPL